MPLESKIRADARRRAINDCLAAVEAEEEFNGPMPDALRLIPMEDALRAAVRATKRGIRDRIMQMSKQEAIG